MTRRWFTSDWHLGHKNILHLGQGRPFATIEEHDTQLISQHNTFVSPCDEVWVLGDVAMGPIGVSLARCASMNGRKILVCGNHDRPMMVPDEEGLAGKMEYWIDRYKAEGGFARLILPDEASQVQIQLSSGLRVRVSHWPYRGNDQEERNHYSRTPDRGEWLLHGHVHHQWQVNGRQINVGVDQWNYEPVSEQAIERLVKEQLCESGTTP